MAERKKTTKSRGHAQESQNSDNSKKAIPVWKFFCYDTGDKPDLWQTWYDNADDRARAAHDVALDYLEQREHHEWAKTPYFKPLKDGIYEVKIRGPIQWRLLGYFGPGEKEFTFLLSCSHKQQIYDPPNAIATAIDRMKEIRKGTAKRVSSARPIKNQSSEG